VDGAVAILTATITVVTGDEVAVVVVVVGVSGVSTVSAGASAAVAGFLLMVIGRRVGVLRMPDGAGSREWFFIRVSPLPVVMAMS
jgi:hypothetical protein